MRIDVISIFPEMFDTFLATGMLRIACEKGLLDVRTHDLRSYTENKHGKVDDKPFGGGPGMVMCCQPVIDAVEAVQKEDSSPGRLIFMGPEGRTLTHGVAQEFSGEERLIFVCGRYEGFDQRIFEILKPEVLSIGDYVLSGGEPAAMVVIDAVSRLLPGVLGSPESLRDESFTRSELDYPHYTQPAEFRGYEVPEVLRSGNHGLVEKWRREKALERTRLNRPDLLDDK